MFECTKRSDVDAVPFALGNTLVRCDRRDELAPILRARLADVAALIAGT
jgi:hypothetical protein